jgi:hypothetical protein
MRGIAPAFPGVFSPHIGLPARVERQLIKLSSAASGVVASAQTAPISSRGASYIVAIRSSQRDFVVASAGQSSCSHCVSKPVKIRGWLPSIARNSVVPDLNMPPMNIGAGATITRI